MKYLNKNIEEIGKVDHSKSLINYVKCGGLNDKEYNHIITKSVSKVSQSKL